MPSPCGRQAAAARRAGVTLEIRVATLGISSAGVSVRIINLRLGNARNNECEFA